MRARALGARRWTKRATLTTTSEGMTSGRTTLAMQRFHAAGAVDCMRIVRAHAYLPYAYTPCVFARARVLHLSGADACTTQDTIDQKGNHRRRVSCVVRARGWL